jgi:hypothetical protein
MPITYTCMLLLCRSPVSSSNSSSKSGSFFWGNDVSGDESNDVPPGDGNNNVERVVIDTPAAGTYTITVIPSYLFVIARPQHYSLVVLGGISSTLDSPFNPAARATPRGR